MTSSEFERSVAVLLTEFSRSGIAELNVLSGDFEIYLSSHAGGTGLRQRSGKQLMVPPRAEQVAHPMAGETSRKPTAIVHEPANFPANARIVTAPNLGTFYRAPKPGAEPYVEVDAMIAEGDEICLIEVMKLFTAVRAEASGRLYAILAEDGSMVEAGQPLFALLDD